VCFAESIYISKSCAGVAAKRTDCRMILVIGQGLDP
jgi:hypothetical protein